MSRDHSTSSSSSHFLAVPSVVSVFVSGSDEGPPRRRLPLLHRLHVAVRGGRRRPAGEEAAAAAGRPSLLLPHHHHARETSAVHLGETSAVHLRERCRRRRRRHQRGEGKSRGGGIGDRHGRGAAADQGGQEPVADVRGVRRRGGGRRGGEGDRDWLPHRRAAHRAHRVGRAEQGREHGHGQRLLPALLPLPPPRRDRHGRWRRHRHHMHQLNPPEQALSALSAVKKHII